MAAQDLHILAGDRRTREMAFLSHWMKSVPTIRRRLSRWTTQTGWEGDFDPFVLNETASVGALANAAVHAKFVALAEYIAFKRKPTQGRPYGKGRCDLWIGNPADGMCFAMEFKHHFAAAGGNKKTLDGHMERAFADAKAVPNYEADCRAGCLIVVPGSGNWDQDCIERLDKEVVDGKNPAFRIGGGDLPVWLKFQVVG